MDELTFTTSEPMEAITDEYRALLESLGDDDECCYLISESKETGERIGTCSFIADDKRKRGADAAAVEYHCELML